MDGPKPNSDLKEYVYVGQSGDKIYTRISQEQKELACSPLVFSISKVPVAAGLLFDIFKEIGITCVAVAVMA